MNAARPLKGVPAEERFAMQTDRSGECWIWTGFIRHDGYGQFKVDGKVTKVHRWSYEHHIGPIPAGKVIDHACFNRACANPAHLRLATLAQNGQNRAGAQRNNRTGVRGVYAKGDRYIAQVKVGGKARHLGYFDTIEEADKVATDARAQIAAATAARAGEAECPTECDPDCDTPCHEDHQVPAKREHDPDNCPGAIAEVLRLRRLLAAQRGGEAVDREALAEMLRAHHWHTGKPSTERCRCGAAVPWVGDAGEDIRRHQADVILAAWGDAAPTEVEWGVWDDGGEIVATFPERDHAEEYADGIDGRLVQRTVSPWREVQG